VESAKGGRMFREVFIAPVKTKNIQIIQPEGVKSDDSWSVDDIEDGGVQIGEDFIAAQNVIWAAGVSGAGLLEELGTETDRSGRLVVGPDLSLPGHAEVLVLGDAAVVTDSSTGRPVPGVAPAAIQMGRYAGSLLAREAREGRGERSPFRYRDKGDMAVISRGRAVARLGGLHLGGMSAWLAWALIHIYFLIGFRRRLLVFLEWIWSFFFHVRGVRLITGNQRPRVETGRVDQPSEESDRPL
jgi:NADH dehydrogenase